MTLYTAGYAGLSVVDLATWLREHDAILADIRFQPSSRAPQRRQSAMQRAFGPRYLHLRQLGNLNYRRGGGIVLADPAAGVEAVGEHLTRQPVVLLCVCADHATCHRAVAAEMIRTATGVEVVHLTRDDFARGTKQLTLL